jgi:CTP:phosphocholine cytidylyltransferase-like protein
LIKSLGKRIMARLIKMGKINLYYDDVIQSLLSKYDIKTVNLTQDGIMEIDSLDDLEKANKAFNSKAPIDSRVEIE